MDTRVGVAGVVEGHPMLGNAGSFLRALSDGLVYPCLCLENMPGGFVTARVVLLRTRIH